MSNHDEQRSAGDEAHTDEAGTDEAGTDEAFARLRGADPAASVTASAGFADAVGARLVPEPEQADAETAAPIALAPRRARRRRVLTGTVAAASALLLVAGGFAAGHLAGASQPMTLEAPASTGESVVPPVGRVAGGDAAMSFSAPWGNGRTVFDAVGLGGEGGIATAYEVPAGSVSAELLRALAAQLGITGEVRPGEGGGFEIGDGNGGAYAASYADGTLSAYDSSRDPWGMCAVSGAAGLPEGPIADDAAQPAIPALPLSCEPAAGAGAQVPPSAADAEAQARALIGALGLDADGYAYASQIDGAAASVTASRRTADGRESDLSFQITIGARGISNVWGIVAEPVAAGEYPVVSPAEAVARLNDPRFGATSTGGPIALRAVAADELGTQAGQPGAGFAPGAPLPWPVAQVRITRAELVLTSQWFGANADVRVLVPSYRLSADDGSAWNVIAVADESLDFSAR